MIFFRRLPSLCYNHVYAVTIALCFSLILLFMLLSWGFLCSNLEPWRHVNKLCKSYEEGEVVGDICSDLCSSDGWIHSYSCRAFHAGKEAVFAATWSNSSHHHRIVVKSTASYENNNQVLDWTNNPYPTEREFTSFIQEFVNSRLNVSLTIKDVEPLSRYPTGKMAVESTDLRHKEMKEIWRLLQDNEYLLCRVYEDLNVFPKVLGTCGSFYLTEYLEPVLDTKLSQLLGQDGSLISWESRLRYGLMLLELIDSLDSLALLICDVKQGHFGLTASGDKIKLFDLDVTYPKVTADNIASDGRQCFKDDDCAIFDCSSKCSESNTCTHPVTTTNIQVICRKVFLGVSTRNTDGLVHLGGLLLGERTPAYLASMLRQCTEGKIKASQLSLAINTVLRSLHPKDSVYNYY